MQCQICSKNQATRHLTEVSEGHAVRELHVCDECAQANNIGYKLSVKIEEVTAQQTANPLGRLVKDVPDTTCTTCGQTYAEFRQKVRAGCEKDYDVFRAGILPLLQKIHGATKHVGKVPPTAAESLQRERKIRDLEREMDQLIKGEQYEKAAQVRDQIKKLREEAGR